MSEDFEAPFTGRYDRFYKELNKLGVPMQVWKEVLVEMYFPVDWANEPDAFKELGHELETFGDRGVYDLTRPKGMSDHDYARGLLKQSQKRRDDRKARVAAEFDQDFMQVPSFEEEDDSEVLADWVKRKSLN